MAATIDTPLFLTDTNPNRKTLNGTHPVLHLNRSVTRSSGLIAINTITDASGVIDSTISAADCVRVMKVPVGAIIEELTVELSGASMAHASATLTAGLGCTASSVLVTTLITAAASEVTDSTVVKMTDRLTTLSPNTETTVATPTSSNNADVISILVAGNALTHVASGGITVTATYRQA